MNSVHTETTERHEAQAPAAWVLYDADCPRCTATARRFRATLRKCGFLAAPLQSLWVPAVLNLSSAELLTQMRVLTREGQVLGGADAAIHLAQHIWWTWPLYALAQLPGMRRVFHAAYRWVAAHRTCTAAACSVPAQVISSARKEGP